MLRTDLTNMLPFNNAYGAIVTGWTPATSTRSSSPAA